MTESPTEKDKTKRVLAIYTKLMNGAVVNKAEEANQYQVNERSIFYGVKLRSKSEYQKVVYKEKVKLYEELLAKEEISEKDFSELVGGLKKSKA